MSRVFTDEQLKEMGTLTIDRLKAAVDSRDAPETIKALADKMYRQFAHLHDGYMNWVSGLLTFIYEKYGIDDVEAAEMEAHTLVSKIAFAATDKEFTFRESVEELCNALTGHVFQPFTVMEDDVKVVVKVHPCGSGGRLQLQNAYENCFATLKEKHPITWGLGNLPVYCCHCPVTEMLELEKGRSLRWVHPTGEDGQSVGPDCEYWLYKNVEDIPEEYYTRLGKKRPEKK